MLSVNEYPCKIPINLLVKTIVKKILNTFTVNQHTRVFFRGNRPCKLNDNTTQLRMVFGNNSDFLQLVKYVPSDSEEFWSYESISGCSGASEYVRLPPMAIILAVKLLWQKRDTTNGFNYNHQYILLNVTDSFIKSDIMDLFCLKQLLSRLADCWTGVQ